MVTRMSLPVIWFCVACTLCTGYLFASETPDEVPFVDGQQLPPANPGEGWKLVCRPAVYKTVTEQVEISPAGSYLEPIPAKWETQNVTVQVAPETKVLAVVPAKRETESFRVMTRPESTRIEVTPARYENVEEEVVVEAAREVTTCVPAQYRTESERIEVSPAYTYWVKNSGGKSIRRDRCGACGEKTRNGDCDPCRVKGNLGDACGDQYSMCEVPAQYRTVCKQVIDKEAATQTVTIPAITKKVCVRKLVADAETRKVVVPAEYATVERGVCNPCEVATTSIPAKFETICKRVIVEPASTRRVEIPAKYETICNRVLDQPATMVWVRTKAICGPTPCAKIKDNCGPAPCASTSPCGDVVKRYCDIPGADEASLLALKNKGK